jgi:hypothetical protein
MKITNFLPVVLLSLLLVGAVSCSTMQQAGGEDEYTSAQSAPSRIYVEDPYHYGRTIVMDRDPVTGRYYEVSPYSVYDSRYDSRFYGNNYYGNRYYDRNYNDRNYRDSYPSRRVQQSQSSDDASANQQKRVDAARVILGKKQ